MIKVIGLAKRKPGMSFEDFCEYYRTKHAKLGAPVMKRAGAVYYKRNYVVPASNMFHGEVEESDFDVVVEFGFPDRESFEKCFEITNEMRDEFITDEEKFLDRDSIRMLMIVEEDESDMSAD